MFCTYCKNTRSENEAPCPHCGAPSPLLTSTYNNSSSWKKENTGGLISSYRSSASWNTANGSPQSVGFSAPSASRTLSNNGWNAPQQASSLNSPWEMPQQHFSANNSLDEVQLTFDSSTTVPPHLSASWSQPYNTVQPARTASQPLQSTPASQENNQQALVPFSYQAQPSQQALVPFEEPRKPTMTLQLVPDQALEHLLPALPAIENPDVVHMPVIYTKPRPIIPRGRAISGFLSVLIVALLLCGGAGYYAKVSGKIDALTSFYTGGHPPNVNPTTVMTYTNPPDVAPGPAINIIPSASTADRVDPETKTPIAPVNSFKVKQKFFLTFSVQAPPGDGKVVTKWYMNNQFYLPVDSKETIKAGDHKRGYMEISYQQACNGSVEIYWNDGKTEQLAQRLFFVVNV